MGKPFDAVALARAAGATYIARTTTYHATAMTRILADAIKHRGFSVVEVLSQCPTYYGRNKDYGDAVAMMEGYRDNTVAVKPDENGWVNSACDGEGAPLPIGVFVNRSEPEYCDSYAKLVREKVLS